MKDRRQNGFTLIEIIIALVFISILAVMMVSFGGNITQSVNPVITLSRSADLQRGMDNLTREYYNLSLPIDHADLDDFKDDLDDCIYVAGVTVDEGRTKFIQFNSSNDEVDDTSATAPNLKVTLVNRARNTGRCYLLNLWQTFAFQVSL